MLTRRTKAYSSSSSVENWGVHAKLIYKYQILYLYRITIIARCHFVNDIDLCCSPKSPTNPQNTILAFKLTEFGTNREPVYDLLLVINSNLGPISDLLAKNRKFCPPPSHLAPSFGVTPFEFMEKLYGS